MKKLVPLSAHRDVRINISIFAEGTDICGLHILRLSGSYLELTKDEECEYLAVDEWVTTDSPEDVFLRLGNTFRSLGKPLRRAG